MKNLTNEYIEVGLLWTGSDEHAVHIKQDENGKFVNDDAEIKDWAYALNNPWSNDSMHYTVHPNHKTHEGWIATKTIIVYDSVEAMIAGNGNTPEEAISNCETFLKHVIKEYGIEETSNDE